MKPPNCVEITMDKFEKLVGTSEREWARLVELGRPRLFKAGETIFFRGDVGDFIFCITIGLVKNVLFLKNGKEKVIHFLFAPSFTGQSGMLNDNRYLCSAVAVTDAHCMLIPRNTFISFLYENPHAMYRVCCDYAFKARCLQAQVEGLYNTVSQNLARFLTDVYSYGIISERQDTTIDFTNSEIASILGTTRQRINQYLNEFEQQGLIRKKYGCIHVLDLDGLQNHT
jgi:CRP-like cAMP-binding protein